MQLNYTKLHTALCDIKLVMPSSGGTEESIEKTHHNYKSKLWTTIQPFLARVNCSFPLSWYTVNVLVYCTPIAFQYMRPITVCSIQVINHQAA
jgi:hypothetical protein